MSGTALAAGVARKRPAASAVPLSRTFNTNGGEPKNDKPSHVSDNVCDLVAIVCGGAHVRMEYQQRQDAECVLSVLLILPCGASAMSATIASRLYPLSSQSATTDGSLVAGASVSVTLPLALAAV